jgi:hypothetical protein
MLVVAALVLVGGGWYAFSRQTDPAAAKDRDAAVASLLTSSDLHGVWAKTAESSAARRRNGFSIKDQFGGACSGGNSTIAQAGMAEASRLFFAHQGPVLQVAGVEVIVMRDAAAASQALDGIAGSARACVEAAVREASSTADVSFTLSIRPASTPKLGDKAAAYRGEVGVLGVLGVQLDMYVVQQGRSVVLLLALDTTGSLADRRFDDLAKTVIDRIDTQVQRR